MIAPASRSLRVPRDFVYSGKIVRRARIGDIEPIRRLAESTPAVARWSRGEYESYCLFEPPSGGPHVKAMFVAGIPKQTRQISDAFHAAAEMEIVGFAALSAVFHAGEGVCELENMAVAEPWRRQGIGARLLAAAELWCHSWGLGNRNEASILDVSINGLHLEVRASNADAIAFYQKYGFERVGRRPGYYANPVEDAILMRLP